MQGPILLRDRNPSQVVSARALARQRRSGAGPNSPRPGSTPLRRRVHQWSPVSVTRAVLGRHRAHALAKLNDGKCLGGPKRRKTTDAEITATKRWYRTGTTDVDLLDQETVSPLAEARPPRSRRIGSGLLLALLLCLHDLVKFLCENEQEMLKQMPPRIFR